MPKLTLSIDEEVINQAKQIAEERGTSVSAMFAQFVNAISKKPSLRTRRSGPLTRKAIGLVKLPKNKTDRALLEEALVERYGR
jgi:hypothetical protein